MTAFFTRCCKNHSPLAALAAFALLFLVFAVARAEGIEVRNAALVAGEEGYFLEADFEMALNPTLEDALNKGVTSTFCSNLKSSGRAGTGSTKKSSARNNNTASRSTR